MICSVAPKYSQTLRNMDNNCCSLTDISFFKILFNIESLGATRKQCQVIHEQFFILSVLRNIIRGAFRSEHISGRNSITRFQDT